MHTHAVHGITRQGVDFVRRCIDTIESRGMIHPSIHTNTQPDCHLNILPLLLFLAAVGFHTPPFISSRS